MNIPTSARLRRVLPFLLSTAAVAAGVLTAVNSPAGIQGSGFSRLSVVGTVTGIDISGTIVVSGFPYSTSGAVFLVDGHPAGPGQISIGDVVSLIAESSGNGGYSATEVTFSGTVQGKVSAIDSQSGTFVLLGQGVHVGTNTVFGPNITPASLAGLSNGATVEVSAYANSIGDLVASRIDNKGQSPVARVVGSARTVNPTRHTFYVNALKVDYGSAQVQGVLAENIPVTVQGNSFAPDGALIANSVAAGNPTRGQPGSLGRIQGLVTNYSSSSYFEVDGQPVIVGAQTQLHLGVPLGLDVAVIVSGSFDTHGVLVADSVTSAK